MWLSPIRRLRSARLLVLFFWPEHAAPGQRIEDVIWRRGRLGATHSTPVQITRTQPYIIFSRYISTTNAIPDQPLFDRFARQPWVKGSEERTVSRGQDYLSVRPQAARRRPLTSGSGLTCRSPSTSRSDVIVIDSTIMLLSPEWSPQGADGPSRFTRDTTPNKPRQLMPLDETKVLPRSNSSVSRGMSSMQAQVPESEKPEMLSLSHIQ